MIGLGFYKKGAPFKDETNMKTLPKKITKMDKLPPQLKAFDESLSKLPIAVSFEEKTKIPKLYAALGLSVLFGILVFLNIWGNLLTNLLGFLYPSYASFKVLETKDLTDDTQWLTYWVVFGFLNLIEFFTDILLFWLPFYYVFKAAIILWLVLPQFKGAHVIYVRFLRPIMKENSIRSAAADIKKVSNQDKTTTKQKFLSLQLLV